MEDSTVTKLDDRDPIAQALLSLKCHLEISAQERRLSQSQNNRSQEDIEASLEMRAYYMGQHYRHLPNPFSAKWPHPLKEKLEQSFNLGQGVSH